MILDIHTHHKAPQPEGVISIGMEVEGNDILRFQRYSLGVHPWETGAGRKETDWGEFERMAGRPEIVAIGEAGVDLGGKGGALFEQLNVFRRQIEISEKLGKPMVIHDVKAHDIIIGLRRDMKPKQNWAIHGFRGKPEVALMLLRSGCWISIGEQFNAKTVQMLPEDRILAESDESPLNIEEIIVRISAAKGKDMKSTIEQNTKTFLTKQE